LARELLGKGHTVRSFGAPEGSIPRSGADPATEGHPAPTEGQPEGLSAFRPDVIVAYGSVSPMAWWGARTSRKIGAPLVLVETGFPSQRRLHERFLSWLGERLWGKLVRRTASLVVALDPIAREQALRAGFQEDRVDIVPAGVDLMSFRPGLSSGLLVRHQVRGRVLLYVGRAEESRGVDALIAAVARTVGQRGDWSLVLAGEGPDRGRLRTMADRLGVGAHVFWLGWPRAEELPGLVSSSTFLAEPATDDSVRGVHIGSALACGVPVLASDRPRFRALVEHEVSGLLAPSGDVAGWTEMIRRAAASPVARRRWGDNARRIAEDRFGWPTVAAVLESKLHRVVAEAATTAATVDGAKAAEGRA
jgi:glycosyltransferase involved in cell wall biosynthesis